MSCERPLRVPNPRYACCIGADNFDQSKSYDGVTIQDYCETYFGYRGRPPDEYVDVPCGKCFSCHKTRMNGWRIRLLSELSVYPNSVFITLTFDNYNLSKFKDNPNRALHLYLDRIRKKYGKQIRHFFIPEYGEKNKRLHYHGILFNYPVTTLNPETVSKEWKYGFVFVGWCNEKTCNYIVKYITKDAPSGQKPPRLVVSKGLGENFVYEQGRYLHHLMTPYLSVNGYARIPLPRYYLTKLFTDNERLYLQEFQRLQPFERYVDGILYTDEYSYKSALKVYADKQISHGLSLPPTKRRPILQSFIFPRVEFKPYTPWDEDIDINDSFNNFYGDSIYYIPLGNNVFHRIQTPF